MNYLTLKSNAKINLILEIIEKRNDGFHNINSFFIPIDLADILHFKPSTEFQLLIEPETLQISLKENTIYKTIKLIQYKHKININLMRIILQKNIPLGAGLGGGSSNAATVLRALNHLYELQIDEVSLIELAKDIGSDVPFFILNKPAIVRGRGEIIIPVEFSFDFFVVLVYPNFQISTKFAYSLFSGSRKKEITDYSEVFKKISSIYEFIDYFRNDFEALLFPHYPILAEIKEKLYKLGAVYSSLSGSGSTVFGIFEDELSIEMISSIFPNFSVFITKPLRS